MVAIVTPSAPSPVPHASAAANLPAIVQPLHLAPGFRPLGAMPAELTLEHVRVPIGGGVYEFYLVDPKHASAPVWIGRLGVEAAPAPQVFARLHVHVELSDAADKVLNATSAPTVRIVARQAANGLLQIGNVELHPAP